MPISMAQGMHAYLERIRRFRLCECIGDDTLMVKSPSFPRAVQARR